MSDSSALKQFDRDTLEPLGVTSQAALHPALKGPLSCAHAEYDPDTGDLYNYNLDFGRKATYRVFKVDAQTRKTTVLATISRSDIKGAYIHSFFLTQNFVVLAVWPAFVGKSGLDILLKRNILDALSFDDDSPCQWLVVDRRHGRGLVARYQSPSFFAFHTVNAYEQAVPSSSSPSSADAVDILCEVCAFDNMDILLRFYYENIRSRGAHVHEYAASRGNSAKASLARYRLTAVPLSSSSSSSSTATTRTVTLDQSIPVLGDLPTFNPNFATRPHRYVYLLVDRGYSSWMDGIAKVDTHTGSVKYWGHPKHTPGEAMFIPNPNVPQTLENEDEGVLMIVVLNGDTSTSYLVCLDAKNLTELARADVQAPVGFGLHGIHLPLSPSSISTTSSSNDDAPAAAAANSLRL